MEETGTIEEEKHPDDNGSTESEGSTDEEDRDPELEEDYNDLTEEDKLMQ